MIGAGTFISPLIKVITTVAVLAAAYFFIVKPVLETTENVSDNVSSSFESFDDVEGFGQANQQTKDQAREAQRILESQQSAADAQIKEANKLLDCIADASGDVNAINNCHLKFDPANP